MFSFENINQNVLQKSIDFLNSHKSYIDFTGDEWKATGENFKVLQDFLINKAQNFSIKSLQDTIKDIDAH
jgi:hypothetical protein